jgi:uncharacterized lipoprotein YmbA
MAGEFLRTETFEVWAKSFDQQLKEALALRAELEETRRDVAVLKDRSESAHKFSITSLITSIGTFGFNLWLKHGSGH